MELQLFVSPNYLLFSDEFRVNQIFFKEKQALVLGGSREMSIQLVLLCSHPALHCRQPEQEFLEFLQL